MVKKNLRPYRYYLSSQNNGLVFLSFFLLYLKHNFKVAIYLNYKRSYFHIKKKEGNHRAESTHRQQQALKRTNKKIVLLIMFVALQRKERFPLLKRLTFKGVVSRRTQS